MKKKILIIDDDKGILDSLEILFTSEGYFVETLANTQHILEKIFTFQPDIIVIDYMLSGITGCEVCKELRQYGALEDIPVIMISAEFNPIQCMKNSGIKDFVSKPFTINEILSKVDTHLQ